MYCSSVLAGSVGTDQQEQKERRQTRRIMTPETANSIRLPIRLARDYLCGSIPELTYVYWFSVIAGSVSKTSKTKKKKKTDRD